MCGVAGIICPPGGLAPQELERLALGLREGITHRGPDDAGLWIDPQGSCALVHRRLSIIDLRPEGRQPMLSENGGHALTFNGEIYNFRELRPALEARGHRFVSRADSEVLLHLLEDEEPPGALERLNGMYALGFWDVPRQRLTLARDPFGKKPLYYAQGPGWFAFASELRPLAALPGFDQELDPDQVAAFLMLQYAPAPGTIFRGARKLGPGSFLTLSPGGEPQVRRFAHFAPGGVTPPSLREDLLPFCSPSQGLGPRLLRRTSRALGGRTAEFEQGAGAQAGDVEELRRRLIRAVERRLISDVPLGAFLSGGVDSSLVVAVMARELGVRPRTFAIGFQGSGESEHLFARQVAQHLGCEHQEEVLAPEIIGLTRQVVEAMDEPNGDTSCLPTYLLCRSARRQVAVSLSGDGADELFLGYPRYFATLEQARRRGGLSPAEHYLAAAGPLLLSPETVGSLLGGLPPYLEGILASWNALLCDERQSLVHRLRALDADTYLPGAVLAKVDRMSMRFALEVRSPFLDREVADFAAGCAPSWCYHAGQGKAILKDLGVKYLPRPWLERPKTGFGIPTDFWRPAELAAWARELLLASDAKLGGHLARLPLTRLLERLARPGQIHVQRFWPLLVLELWLRSL